MTLRTQRSADAGAPSQRQLRVAELVRHALAELFARGDTREPELDGVILTIPEVRMSPDLKVATALVMPLGGRDIQKTLKALDRARGWLRMRIARQVQLKSVPELRFRLDTRYDDDARVEDILNSEPVKRDLSEEPERDA
ncbi:30S ribosome-binding factor RbfA [Segnochrobactraceae bacterium EtOH-i3]